MTGDGATLVLEDIRTSRHALVMRTRFADLSFSTTYWYHDLDVQALAARFSRETVDRLVFHIALFELQKLCSLRPARLELGPWARFWTRDLDALWRTVFQKVWAQWRYENHDPDYLGPRVEHPYAPPPAPVTSPARAEAPILAFCGGGKDSLVTMRLFEAAGLAYDTLVYSSSIYGPAAMQHELVGALVDRCAPRQRLRQWIHDDFLDSPVLALHPELGVATLAAAETPCSIFGALPLALAHGYTTLCLGHERSADRGQVTWRETGEDVNHQWGKSLAAQRLLDQYIRTALLADVRCVSPLKPVYDPVIFGFLARVPDDVPYTHSCNLRKPWCLACPKCLYVWLGYAAFLPRALVRQTFGADDLLDRPALVPMVRALLGVDGAQPFECIGTPGEVALYLAACRARGYTGPAVGLLDEAPVAARLSSSTGIDEYLSVDLAALPDDLAGRLGPVLADAADRARAQLAAALRGDTA